MRWSSSPSATTDTICSTGTRKMSSRFRTGMRRNSCRRLSDCIVGGRRTNPIGIAGAEIGALQTLQRAIHRRAQSRGSTGLSK